MAVKDGLHAFIDQLGEDDAREALSYLRTRLELPSHPSQVFVEECQAALDEAFRPDAVRVPQAAIRAWLQAWGTPAEETAEKQLDALESCLRKDA